MPVEAKELVKQIVEWCSDHGHAESEFLSPIPMHFILTFDLLDFLAEKTGMPREKIGAWFNAQQEKNATER